MIATKVSLLVVGLWIALVKSQSSAEPKCMPSHDKFVKLSISNRRNQTGHMISKVAFKHDASTPNAFKTKETKLWTVDMEQETESCEGDGSTTNVVFTITAPIRQPHAGYELFSSMNYYKFHDNVVTWPRASEICAEEEAHLVIINSEQEADVTKTLFARYPKVAGATDNNWAWTGAKEVDGVNGQYVTIYDVPLNQTGFTRWSPGEPNNPSTGDYLLVNRANGGLADVPSSAGWKVPFICEQEL